jgi:hypothetical protein
MMHKWFQKLIAIFNYNAAIKIRQWREHGLNLDPNHAIWFFGCSHVFGSGLDNDQTAPHQLSRLLNCKVVNYGRPGISPIAIKNQIELLLKDYKPKGIVVAWPSFDRWQSGSVLWIPQCLTGVKMHSDNFGNKKLWPKEWNQYKEITLNGKLRELNSQAVIEAHELIFNIPYVEFSYTPNDYGFPTPRFPFDDLAADGSHPGVRTQQQIAQWVNNELQLLL